jgi:hypothetical protein
MPIPGYQRPMEFEMPSGAVGFSRHSILQQLKERKKEFSAEDKKLTALWKFVSTGTAQTVYLYPIVRRTFGEKRAKEAICKDLAEINRRLSEMGI